jgi:prepilin-type N-terminal cleavage/methylation domain-containing protein
MKFPGIHFGRRNPPTGRERVAAGFSLVEVLVVIVILGLIVLVLMSVFGSTQRAFRASVTQTDVLQGGRAAVELITSDLRTAAPCDGFSVGTTDPFLVGALAKDGVNFFVTNNAGSYVPLALSLPGSSFMRTNLLQMFFVLGHQNTKWTGVGYFVNNASTTSLYPLYRYYMETNSVVNPAVLFTDFIGTIAGDINANNFTNLSHVMDGVVHLVVRGYDNNGILMTNGWSPTQMISGLPRNTCFTPPYPASWGEVGFTMSSNAVPATVELQMAVLEDRALQRATSLGTGSAPAPGNPQWNYLQAQSGHVHVFRERVTIENLDPGAYQ